MSAPGQIKVAVCIPSGDTWCADFGLSLLGACAQKQLEIDGRVIRIGYQVFNARSSVLPDSRNELTNFAIESGADYAMMFDSDQVFPEGTIRHLLRLSMRAKVQIVGLTYPARQQGRVRRSNAFEGHEGGLRFIDAENTSGILEVAACGTGILLVRMDVFKAIPRPWFEFVWNTAGKQFEGEDIQFCAKARAHGFRILVDFDFSRQVAHVGSFQYSLNATKDAASLASAPLDVRCPKPLRLTPSSVFDRPGHAIQADPGRAQNSKPETQ